MDNFHVEYQSTDVFGNTFRQLITANHPIKENLDITNVTVPVLFKFKTDFSEVIGFTADAGMVVNLQEHSKYNSNASFDYEAIYSYTTDASGHVSTVYDKSVTPATGDVLLTKSQYLATHSSTSIQNYFNSLSAQGYNVGLGVKPPYNAGDVTYRSGSIGILVRPAISFYLSDLHELNVGAYYLYQNFSNYNTNNRLTDGVGSYNSVLTTVNGAVNNSYGVSVGWRYHFPDNSAEKCVVSEAPAPEREKVMKEDKDEDEPEAEETEKPRKSNPAPEEERVVREKPEVYKAPERIDVSTPILFDENKMEIKPTYYPVLDEAIKELKGNKKAYLVINGYADNTGKAAANKVISQKRAGVVKNYLAKKGVSATRMETVGHGSLNPAASNNTKEGRAKNRRVIMKVKQKK
jgi:outer membrane protein OmpA-like peptidoglycan-associated protein